MFRSPCCDGTWRRTRPQACGRWSMAAIGGDEQQGKNRAGKESSAHAVCFVFWFGRAGSEIRLRREAVARGDEWAALGEAGAPCSFASKCCLPVAGWLARQGFGSLWAPAAAITQPIRWDRQDARDTLAHQPPTGTLKQVNARHKNCKFLFRKFQDLSPKNGSSPVRQ